MKIIRIKFIVKKMRKRQFWRKNFFFRKVDNTRKVISTFILSFIPSNQGDILCREEFSGFELIYMRMVNFVVPLGKILLAIHIYVYGEC